MIDDSAIVDTGPVRSRSSRTEGSDVPMGALERAAPLTPTIIRWSPAVVLGALLLISQVRTGVEITDVVRYSCYWGIAVLLPGVMASRSLLGGARKNVVEDLAIGAITGMSIEIVMWIVGVTTGVGAVVRFWWVAAIVAGLAVPRARQRWMVRIGDRIPATHGAALACVSLLVMVRLDVFSFRSAPLPPEGGALFHDLWWHLSLVQELMKFERPQVPQVVGEPLNYHFFSHIHIASGSRLSGVLPEVVLLRLWLIPIVLISVGLAFTLGRMLTSSLTAGVLAAWLGLAVSIRTYVWVDLTGFAANPVLFHSPSQLLANACILAVTIGFVMLLREPRSAGLVVWIVLIVGVAGGSKSTIAPIIIAATLLTFAWALMSRAPVARVLGVAAAGLIVLQAGIYALASGTSGGTVVVFGILKSLPVYKGLVPSDALLGMNDGLLLDSINSPKRAALAAVAVAVSVAMHACRIVGVVALSRRQGRADPVYWWLSGAVVAGFAATLMIDHVGLSQTFFAMTAVPVGAALTIAALWDFAADRLIARRTLILRGLGAGVVVSLLLDYFVRARQRAGGYGAFDRIVFPVFIVAILVGLAALFRSRLKKWTGPAVGFGLALVIGMTVPAEVEFGASSAYRWVQPVRYPAVESSGDYLTTNELSAMVWLRENSGPDDVIMTNVHCRPIATVPLCDARGFWVAGLAGRRAVMEGWGYTNEAQALQGVEGRVYARQPSPFVEIAALNDAVFDHGDVDALSHLKAAADVKWVVEVRRASPSVALPDSAAVVRFENDDVRILEVVS